MSMDGGCTADGDGGVPRSGTILVVEDDANTRRVLVLLLEVQGYEVVQSSDAEDGMAVVREVAPDLVVSDLQLPGMSGMELAASIAGSERAVPVIAITSGPDALVERARGSRHFSEVLRKPVDVDQLLELVDGIMSLDGA